MKKIFLICPVRGVDPELHLGYVKFLEDAGHKVHFPHRDTDQEDMHGFRICTDNRGAINESDQVHFIWDGKSQGCLFDLGMAFALNKPVVAVSLPAISEGKSFQNMVRCWEIDAR